jgi:rare lipoprotein A (peptidoglycan hydrolase)
MPCATRVLFALVLGAALFAPGQATAATTGTTATYYHPSLHGSRMANGLPYNRWDPMIAANNWYPLGTLLKVTRQGTDQYIYVRVQDRGSRALTLDLSEAGFAQLGGLGEGRIPIWLEVVTTIEGQGPRAVEHRPDESTAPADGSAAGVEEPADPAVAAGEAPEEAPAAPLDPDPLPIGRRIRALDGDTLAMRFLGRP